MFKKLLLLFFQKKKIRKDLKFVSYSSADTYLKNGYTLAKEEDTNKVYGWVYLELLEDSNGK